MHKHHGFSILFSYWLLVWFILFEFKIIEFNPKPFLVLGLIENLIQLVLMLSYKNSLRHILSFIFINFIIKVLPIYILWNEPWTMRDIIAGSAFFSVYLLWIKYNKMNIINLLLSSYTSIKEDTPLGPLMKIFDDIM